MVEERTDRQRALLFPNGPLHPPQTLIGLRDLLSRQIGIGPEHKLPIEPGICRHRLLVDPERAPRQRHTPGIASIADQRCRAACGQLLLQPLNDRLSRGGIVAGFVLIAARALPAPADWRPRADSARPRTSRLISCCFRIRQPRMGRRTGRYGEEHPRNDRGGYTMEKVLEAYPELTREDVAEALSYASQVIDEEKIVRRA